MDDEHMMKSSLDKDFPPNNQASKNALPATPPPPTNPGFAPKKKSDNPFRKLERIFFDGDIVEATVYTVKNTLRPAFMKAFTDVLRSWGARFAYGPNQNPPPDVMYDRASYREDFTRYSSAPKPKEIVRFSNALLKFPTQNDAYEFAHWVKRDFVAQNKYFTVADALESNKGGKKEYGSEWNDNSYGWDNDTLKTIEKYVTQCSDGYWYILLPQPIKFRT